MAKKHRKTEKSVFLSTLLLPLHVNFHGVSDIFCLANFRILDVESFPNRVCLMGVREYDLQTQLGKGSQGVVWKAKRKADGVLVAIKQIMLGSVSRREQADAAQEVSAQSGLIPPTCPVRDRWHRDLCRRCVLASTASARSGRVGAQALKRVHAGMPSWCGCATRSGCWRG